MLKRLNKLSQSIYRFRMVIPQKTGRSFLYSYKQVLKGAAEIYFREVLKVKDKNARHLRDKIAYVKKFNYEYENGFNYIVLELKRRDGLNKNVTVNLK